MKQWMRVVSLVVASVFWMGQAVPVAYAAHDPSTRPSALLRVVVSERSESNHDKESLRPKATDKSGGEEAIRGDTTWVWGPGGEGMSSLGRANLVSMGKEIVSAAFNEGRAFALVGPGARPIDELVETYAAGYQRRLGAELSEKEKAALKGRLGRVKEALNQLMLDLRLEIPIAYRPKDGSVEQESPQFLASRLVRFVPILDETGTPALVSAGVSGTSTHHALVAYGGQHAYAGWNTAAVDLINEFIRVVRERGGLEIGPDDLRSVGDFLRIQNPKSVYLSLAQVEGMLAQGDDGLRALKRKLGHEVRDVVRGRHEDEPPQVRLAVDAAISKVFAGFQKEQKDRRAEQLKQMKAAARKKAQALGTRVQLVPYVMNLGRFFKGQKAPGSLIEGLRNSLAEAARRGQITDFLVQRLGDSVLLQINYNGPSRNPKVDRLVVSVVSGSLSDAWNRWQQPPGEAVRVRGIKTGPLTPEAWEESDLNKPTEAIAQELLDRPYTEQAKALGIRTGEFPFNERPAEPIYVSIALGGNLSAYNRPIMQLLKEALENQLKIEGTDAKSVAQLKTEHARFLEALKLGDEDLAKWLKEHALDIAREVESEGPGYTVIVERVADIRAGKRDRTAYAFVFPRSAPYIHSLVNDQTEWVITRVLPRPGSKLFDPTKGVLQQDPMIVVMVDQVGKPAAGESFNPVFVARQQSGAPAIGEFVSATANFYIATAGPNGAYHRGAIPVTFEEADTGKFNNDGRVEIVSYSYQSNNNGHIPPGGVRDQVALANDVRPVRHDQKWVHDALLLHGSFQPHTTAPAALEAAEEAAHALGPRFHQVPAAVELDAEGRPLLGPDKKAITKLDPVLEASNAGQILTISDLKADIGGDPGHQVPPDIYVPSLRASLKAAQRAGLIKAFEVQSIGDDMHLWIFHDKGADSRDIHTLAWWSFFRAGWVIKKVGYPELTGYAPYGFMQDLVSPDVQKLIKEGKLEAFANLDDQFIEALKEEIQAFPKEAAHLPEILRAYEDYKTQRAAGTVIELPFSGNVRGQGIGFAEITVAPGEKGNWSVIASDKTGPGAYNRRMYLTTRLALLLAKHAVSDGDAPFDLIRDSFRRELANRIPEAPEALRDQLTVQVLKEIKESFVRPVMVLDPFRAYRQRLSNGLVYEVWDVKANTRAFLDAEADDAQLLKLLSATNDFNVKRIWTKKRGGWLNDLTPEAIARITAQVEARREAIRAEIEQRKKEVEGMLARKEKKEDQLIPWDQAILKRSLEEALAMAVAQEIELAKAREFLGDSYLASFSTEKLAVAGGGQYLGKDDPTAWMVEPLANIYRALTKVTPTVTLGDARGSHWVAVRPEDKGHIVAVAWSNSVEGAFRFNIGEGGTVPVDATTGRAVGKDMYAGAEWDKVRETVARFNKVWIDTQGGFTPHGPNIGDVESAYPYRTTVNALTAPNSPFATPMTDTTRTSVEQGRWVEQYPDTTNYLISPVVAEQAADQASPRWILIHSSVFTQGPDAAMVFERINRQLDSVLASGQSAMHFALIVDGASTAEEAERISQQLFAAIPSASAQTARLSREDFQVVLPARQDPDAMLGLLQAASPGSRPVSLVGPSEWAKPLKQESPRPDEVGIVAFEPAREEAKVASGARAIVAGVEAAATGGKLDSKLAARLNVLEEAGLISPKPLDVVAETATEVRAYQEKVKAIEAAGEKV